VIDCCHFSDFLPGPLIDWNPTLCTCPKLAVFPFPTMTTSKLGGPTTDNLCAGRLGRRKARQQNLATLLCLTEQVSCQLHGNTLLSSQKGKEYKHNGGLISYENGNK
jgi:hypothetical protein